MGKAQHSSILFLLSSMAFPTYATDDVNAKQFLLDQVLWGESYYQENVVKQTLSRLELIAPDDPEVLAAEIRLAIHQHHLVKAKQLIEKLRQQSPESALYKRVLMSYKLAEPDAIQKMQHARILALSGRPILAKEQYDSLMHGDLPTPEMASEYWIAVAAIPQQRQNAFKHLQELYEFLNAHKMFPDNINQGIWLNGLRKNLSRLWDTDGDVAFKAGDLQLALNNYQKATELNPNNYSAWVGMGDIALAQKDFTTAETRYKQALALNPNTQSPIYGLVSVYKHQSLEKALAYLDHLPEEQKIKFQVAIHGIESDIFQQKAERFIKANQWSQAIDKLKQAQKLDPDNIWLAFHFATALHHVGQDKQANNLFNQLSKKNKNNLQFIYSYALYLSNADKTSEALASLHQLPQKKWNKDIKELAQRLTTTLVMNHAQKLREAGDKSAATSYLLRQPQTTPIKLALADWAFNDNQFAEALGYYENIKAHEPKNADANLGEIESLIALGKKNKAHHLLMQQQNKELSLTPDMQRRTANAWNAVGNSQKAMAIFQSLKQKDIHVAPSQSTALLFRDAARLEQQLRQVKLAQNDYKQAMVDSKITPVYPQNNETYTRLMRNRKTDDWLQRGIRAEASQLFQQQETRFTVDQDYWRLAGNAGTSDTRAEDTIVQADWALSDGRAFLRTDKVEMSSGDFSPVNGVYTTDFGTCANGCTQGIAQRANGISWDAGWQNARWGMDIGQTPVGFTRVNWIGGINYSGEIKHIGWTLTASQRPMTNSLLSFAGTVDPNTGIRWGGVVATGLTLSASYDRGGANGVWANLIASQLTGENVATNQRILLMEGYYHKLINEDNRRATIGLTNMVWHYQKNLYGFALGQGGYYSPKKYVSLTLPVDYRQRTEKWSYELGASATWSQATTQSNLLYPLPNLVPGITNQQNKIQTGSSGVGYGYSLLALIERRLSTHLVCGGLLNFQQSTDYTPSHFSIFLRYSLEGWQGDLDLPIVPLIPYSNFR